MHFLKMKTVSRLALCLAVGLMLSACATVYKGYKPPTDVDVFEKAPNSLDYEVVGFKWTYLPDGVGLRVTGQIKNNTGKAGKAVIYAMLFDEVGLAVGMGEAKIYPIGLAPGRTGSFSLTVATNRPKGQKATGGDIKHLRLLTNTQDR